MRLVSTPLGRVLVPERVPPGFALFYTTRDVDGRLSGDVAKAIADIAREHFGVVATLTTCTQVHGVRAAQAGAQSTWRECDECDALWSTEAGTALGIKVADCLPVALIDRERRVIANIHSGWRGAVQRIVRQTIETMQRETTFDTARAWLGPSIRVCCFEVGEEVAVLFDPRYVDRTLGPKPHVDLVAFTRDELAACGITDVVDTGICTRCDGSLFHSFRRDNRSAGVPPAPGRRAGTPALRTGRNLAVVAQ